MHERLKECRISHEYSQKYVAMTLGVSMPTVSQWETGVKRPSIENLTSLAALYNTTIDYLVGIADEDGNIKQARQQGDPITPAERRLILAYRSLNSQGREYICQQMDIAQRLYTGESADIPNMENK